MEMNTALKGAVLAATLSLSTTGAFAQWAPSGPVKIQIGFGAGGTTDTLGRAIAAAMEKTLAGM